MYPTSVVALLLFGVAVLPGATYRWAYERETGAFGVTLADRALRLVAVSLLLDALYAWPAYLGWRAWFAGKAFAGGQFTVAWCASVVGVAVPYALGTVVGGLSRTAQSRDGWPRVRRMLPRRAETWLLRLLVGRNAAPRAWDRVFTSGQALYLRIRLRDGSWREGYFGRNSHAGTFPHANDLLLEEAWPTGATGPPAAAEDRYALYLTADSIDVIEIAMTRKDAS
jgi:hypothetical protein